MGEVVQFSQKRSRAFQKIGDGLKEALAYAKDDGGIPQREAQDTAPAEYVAPPDDCA